MSTLNTPSSLRVNITSKGIRPPSQITLKPERLCLGLAKNSRTLRFKVYAKGGHKVKLIGPDGEEEEFEVREGNSVLEAAEDEGMELPYSCRSGNCGTCAGQIVSGSVDQSQGTFLDDDQIEEGYVLTCIAQPLSDCVIYTHKQSDLN